MISLFIKSEVDEKAIRDVFPYGNLLPIEVSE